MAIKLHPSFGDYEFAFGPQFVYIFRLLRAEWGVLRGVLFIFRENGS